MKILLLINFFISSAFAGYYDTAEYTPETGDIIAHTSKSSQSTMIQVGTMSKYSHIGVIFVIDNEIYVFEAIATTRLTKLEDFIKRGKNKDFTIYRYAEWLNANSEYQRGLTVQQKQSLTSRIRNYRGSKYDLAFKWSDDKMYCSELVWKMYNDIGISLTETRKIRSFNIWIPKIRKVMEARWGGEVNMDEPVVAPKDITRSRRLQVVYNTY